MKIPPLQIHLILQLLKLRILNLVLQYLPRLLHLRSISSQIIPSPASSCAT